ncbi:MAG: metallophosphoesterase, partial [Coprothermobacterota bacterium]|nr:metallophosphoesterase [Coprothermobacterota bacterium]
MNRIRQGILAGFLAIVCLLPISGWAGAASQIPATSSEAPSGELNVVADASSPGEAPVPIDRNRINQVIYPSFGNPAILRCGDQLTIEFDPRDQNWSLPFPVYQEFSAFLRTSNGSFPLTKTLRVDGFTIGYSAQWPEYAQARNTNARIYLVKVAVPADVPSDLYDLTLSGKGQDGVWLLDSQPHAVSVVAQFKQDYTFCQMTDIHVWGPEAKYPGASTQDKNYRHTDYRETDGYGAAYYHKAIEQVNLTKPDFAVFTGDYDFSQKWLYKQNYAEYSAYRDTIYGGRTYEPYFEMDWFYQETLKLDVPVFMTLGNHDSYSRYNLFNTKLEEDYMNSWRNLFGPQYFSFDYGPDAHFLALNSNDWSSSQRNLHWAIPNVILVPGKWQ